MKLKNARSLLGLLLLTLASVPILVLADDILITWGPNLMIGPNRQSQLVPGRTYISKSEITSVYFNNMAGYSFQTITVIEGERNVSIWSNELNPNFLPQEELQVPQLGRNRETFKLDLGDLSNFLPVNIKIMVERTDDGFYLTTRGELYHFANSFDAPVHIPPSEFFLVPGSTFVDVIFTDLKCASSTCIAVGNSGRLYISTQNGGYLSNPSFPSGPRYQNFYEFDTSMLSDLDIAHWSFNSEHLVFANRSGDIYEAGLIGYTGSLVPVLNNQGTLATGSPPNIAFLVSGSGNSDGNGGGAAASQTLIVTTNLETHVWSGFTTVPYSAGIVETFLNEQRALNNEIVQIAGPNTGWYLLMTNGKVFSFNIPDPNFQKRDVDWKKRDLAGSGAYVSLGHQYTVKIVSDFVAEVFLGTSVPSTHKITSLVSNPQCSAMGAIVKPRVAADAALAIEKTLPENSSGSVLISWGIVSPMLGTGWNTHSETNLEFASMEPVHLSHLSTNLRNITKVATGGPVILALTQDGHVMSWGCTVQSNEGCWHATPMIPSSGPPVYSTTSDLPALSLPIPIDPLYLQNQTVVDVSVSQTVSAIILDDGFILFWSTTSNMPQKKRFAKKDGTFTMPPASLNTELIFGTFDKVFSGFDTVYAIDSTNHVLTVRDIPNLMQRNILVDFDIIHFDAASDIIAAIIVARNLSTGNLHLLTFEKTLGATCNGGVILPTAPFFLCDATGTVPFSLSAVRQVLVLDFSGGVVVMTDTQIYIAGGSKYFGYTDSDTAFRPLPQVLPVPISSISKMVFLEDQLGLLTTTGDLYLTFDENKLDMSSSSDVGNGNFTLMKSDYIFDSIPTHQNAIWRAAFVAFGTKKSPQVPSTSPSASASTTDLSSFFFGSNIYCQFGMDGCSSASVDEITETDPLHPVNSPTATQISLGYVGSLVDGTVANGFQITRRGQGRTTQTNRVVRWGGPKDSPGGSARYQQVTYQEAPVYIDEQAALASAAVSMVKTMSVGTSHVTLFSNCSLSVQWYSQLGPYGHRVARRSTWPDPGTLGLPISVSDTAYGFRALREFYEADHYPMSQMISYGACGGPEAPVAEDLQCRERSNSEGIGNDAVSFHCTIRSGSRLFSLELAVGGVINCQTGLLGLYDECVGNTSSLPYSVYGLVEVDTTSPRSAFSGRSVVQYRLGFQHAVALNNDGTVVSWGDNTYGQLGLGDPNTQVTDAPTIPPSIQRDLPSSLRIENVKSRDSTSSTSSTTASKRSISLITYVRGIPTRTALPLYVSSGRKVFASGLASFLLTKDHRIFGWGSNLFGTLGRGIEPVDLLDSPHADRVALPYDAITDAECGVFTCYALYDSGAIFSWGNNGGGMLGRDSDVPNSVSGATPSEAKRLKFKDRKKKPKEIIVGPGTVLIRGKEELPGPPACPGKPPSGGNFTCVGGLWTNGGDLTLTRTFDNTPALIVQTPIYIVGNLTVPQGESIQIIIDDVAVFDTPEKPYMEISGCFQGGGEIQFLFEQRAWVKFKNEGDGKKLTTIESSCQMQQPGSVVIQQVDAPETCQKASAKSYATDRPNAKFGLQSTFTVNTSRCTRWWMILLSVIAAVLIITAIIAIAYRIKKTQTTKASTQRIRTPSTVRST